MISIIVPVYQVELYLRQCIESILSQTYKFFELILINDESTDSSDEICKEYAAIDSRIRFFTIPHSGLSAARNKGIEEARGEWIGFVDSDDWIEPEMYGRLLSAAEKSSADIAVCGFVKNTDQGQKESNMAGGTYSSNQALEKLSDGSVNNMVWNKLYRRDLFNSIRFPDGRNYEDIFVQHLLFYQARTITVIEDAGYHYRLREGSIAHTDSAKNLIDYAYSFIERFYFYNDISGVSRDSSAENVKIDQEQFLKKVASSISRVWRRWYGFSEEEKAQNRACIRELKQFTRDNFPLFGCSSWEMNLRMSTFFMHYDSKLAFAVLYMLNQLYRKARHHK